jgi:hypothetical protein
VANFEHDSRAELTVYRPSDGLWYIRFSSHDNWNIGGYQAIQWGQPGDVPFSGDFDGDGRTELTVFRPSNGYWFVRFSTLEYSVDIHGEFQWGLSGDASTVGRHQFRRFGESL